MLALRSVDASYGPAKVLDGLTMAIGDAEAVVLLGRNGMGKSSTMQTIIGWPEPRVASGTITFHGRDLLGLPQHRVAAAGLGYVPQGRRIFPSLSVEDHLRVVAAAKAPAGPRWTTTKVFDLFPLLARRRRQRAATLSGGEQQMLVIGRALLTNPRLLLLDEPSEGLAPMIIRQVGDIVTEVRREGVAILIAEQDVRFALGLADRVLVLERGAVVAEGTPQQIDADNELKHRHLGVGTGAAGAAG